MKKILLLVLVALIAIGAAFAGGSKEAPAAPKIDYKTASWDDIVKAAKAEGQVTFYAWYFAEYFKEAAIDFEKQYGVKANVIIGDQTANFNKAIAEKDSAAGTIDVMIVGGQWVKTTMDLNLFYGPIKAIIPEADKLAPSLWEVQEGFLTGGYLAPFHRNQTGLLYDPDQVKNPPQTWEELTAWIDANPKKFGFCDPSKAAPASPSSTRSSPTPRAASTSTKATRTSSSPRFADWDKAWKWVNDRKEKLTITVSNNDSIIRMNGGEISMAVAWDDNVKDMMSKGNLFKRAQMYIPKMGFAGGGDTMGVPKNAPHKGRGAPLDPPHHDQGTADQEIRHHEGLPGPDGRDHGRNAPQGGRTEVERHPVVPGPVQVPHDQRVREERHDEVAARRLGKDLSAALPKGGRVSLP